MLADPRAVINGSWFPPMTAEPVQGGYRVSGRTAFASGSNYSTWFGAQALVMENGAPQFAPNGMPVALVVHFPAAETGAIRQVIPVSAGVATVLVV